MTENQQDHNTSKMRVAILRAGYLLEIETATTLRSQGFRVETNPPYLDPKTGNQREIDLVASFASLYRLGDREDDWLCPVMVIECKSPQAPMVLFTTEWSRDFESDGHERWEALQIVGHPRLVTGSQDEKTTNWSWLAATLGLPDFHHYATSSVATQFCSFETRNGSNGSKAWQAQHTKEAWDAISTLIAATTYQMQRCYEDPPESTKSLNLEVFYPVVVLGSKLYEAKLDATADDGFQLREVDQLQYRYTAIRGARQEDFQIDIVTSSHFPKFVDMIKQESTEMARRIDQTYARVRDIMSARQRRHRRRLSGA